MLISRILCWVPICGLLINKWVHIFGFFFYFWLRLTAISCYYIVCCSIIISFCSLLHHSCKTGYFWNLCILIYKCRTLFFLLVWITSVLITCLCANPFIQEIYSVKLPGNPKLGEGKPENQNHAVIFTRGQAVQTIDMNQVYISTVFSINIVMLPSDVLTCMLVLSTLYVSH